MRKREVYPPKGSPLLIIIARGLLCEREAESTVAGQLIYPHASCRCQMCLLETASILLNDCGSIMNHR